MRKVFGVILAVVLVFSVTAIAADKTLSDQQLAGVVAGTNFDSEGASGALVANGSSKSDTDVNKVDLSGYAMAGVKGLTVANTSGGMLAVGINVFDGTTLTNVSGVNSGLPSVASTLTDVKQSNYLSNYAPGPGNGVTLLGYKSSGSLFLDDPSLTIKNNSFNLELAAWQSSKFKVDAGAVFGFAGSEVNPLKISAFPFGGASVTGCAVLGGACGTVDASGSQRSGFYADLDYDQFYMKFTAEKIAWRGPLYIGYASAGDIVLDGSTETTKEISVVELSGNTMNGASGVYILNAANTLAGIGVNVGTIGTAAQLKSFTQCNTVINGIGKH